MKIVPGSDDDHVNIRIVDDRVTTVQQGMVKVIDYLELEKRVGKLEEKVEELIGKK